jgi:molybdate transport system substrate-binding protein
MRVGIGFSGTCDEEGALLEATALAGKRSLRMTAVLKLMRRCSAMSDTIRVLSTLALKGAVQAWPASIRRPAACVSMPISRRHWRCWSGCARARPPTSSILTREGLDEVAREGRVVAESCVDLARSWVGIAVKAGAPIPISRPRPRCARLLGARSVAYSRLGASGILFAKLIERLGIAAEINARAVIIPQGFTAETLVTGEADLAVQQISELKQIEGTRWSDPFHTRCKRLRCFRRERMAATNSQPRRTGYCGFSRRPKSRRRLRESGLDP